MQSLSDSWSFIDEYVSLLDSVTDAPHNFKLATAMYLLSTCAGRKYLIMSQPDSRFFADTFLGSGKLLNLWYILIGKTRISRKSTVVGRAEEFVRQIDNEIVLPQDFTPQSLISSLKEKTIATVTRATWIHDEVSGFFELLRKGDYMVSTDAVLSRIYDGRSYYRRTITRGSEDILNPYLTILAASTDSLPALFSETMIKQGFLNRFIYASGKRETYNPLTTDDGSDASAYARDLLTWLRSLYNAQRAVTLFLNADSLRMYTEYEMEIEDKIFNQRLGIEEGYLGNLPNIVLRFAALHRIANYSIDDLENTGRMSVTPIRCEDLDWGINYGSECWDNFKEILNMMRTYATSRESVTEEREIERVFEIINTHTPISRSELYRKATLRSSRLEEMISTLMTQERVKLRIDRTSTKPTLIYEIVTR